MGCCACFGKCIMICASCLLILLGASIIIGSFVFSCYFPRHKDDWEDRWLILIGALVVIVLGAFLLKCACSSTGRRIRVVTFTATNTHPPYTQSPYNPYWSEATVVAPNETHNPNAVQIYEYSHPNPTVVQPSYDDLPPSYDSVVKATHFIHPNTVPQTY